MCRNTNTTWIGGQLEFKLWQAIASGYCMEEKDVTIRGHPDSIINTMSCTSPRIIMNYTWPARLSGMQPTSNWTKPDLAQPDQLPIWINQTIN